jgi:hypothetical protein
MYNNWSAAGGVGLIESNMKTYFASLQRVVVVK